MRISIVTVNLNDAAGLRATAESVAAQQYREREWLVIDGGSSDGSPAVIQAFAAEIAFGSSVPDRGVYDALNRGLKVICVMGVGFPPSAPALSMV